MIRRSMRKARLRLTQSLACWRAKGSRASLRARSSAVFQMMEESKLELRIAHIYKLADAQQAHRDLEARKTTGKLLLLP